MKIESMVVRRRYWRTVHDARKKRPDRVRYDAVIRLDCGIELHTTRINRATAERLVQAGATLDAP